LSALAVLDRAGVDPTALLKALEGEQARRRAENRLRDYRPYAKQRAFHAASGPYRERLLMAGNQLGKTLAGGFESAMHLTGRYPDWWEGRRFDTPVRMWASGVTREGVRDGAQRVLLGRPGELGTGTIPKAAIIGTPLSAQGVPDGIASAKIEHVSGGVSHLAFKSYDQGREKWQAETLEIVWFDEEPPEDIYTEGLTRTNAAQGGMVYMTFTPLLGMSRVVKRFLSEPSPDRSVTTMTIEDAEHYTPEQRQRIIDSYPPHEREARTKGVPMLGGGLVYPVPESLIAIDPIIIPKVWKRIVGLDIGWDHPTAAVWLAWDADTDTVYVTDCYRVRQGTVSTHASAIRARGLEIPVAWPHDGLQHDKGSGDQIAALYRKEGVAMLPERATFGDGTNGVEAGVMDILGRMETGRFKVFRHLNDWWEEFRLYHRDEGKIVKEGDDLMSATRYGVMMLRHAKSGETHAARKPRPGGGWMAA